jgi:UDP-glucose 4-epimerase
MKNILVTGGTGYIGSLLIEELSKLKNDLGIETIVTAAILPPKVNLANTIYEYFDVRDEKISTLINKYKIDCVVHLATIVTPGKKSNRDLEYSVDVEGTKNVLNACVANKVKRIIVTSSGAAYGYHPENRNLLTEESALRGNYEFAYSYHKKLVEMELERFRKSNPELEQVIFRIGTVLGLNVNNQISDLFKKSYLIGVMGSKSPFNFILDTDVAKCLLQAITSPTVGIYNLAGDGYLTIDDFSQMLKKPKILLPPFLIKHILNILKKLGLTQYGPEQVLFLQYRPVLDNSKLKTVFRFIPQMTSKEVFAYFIKNNLKR